MSRAWILAAVTTLLAGCGDEPTAGEGPKAHVRDYLQRLLIEEDWSRWDDFYAPDASVNGSDFALQIMRGTATGINFSFGDLQLEINDQVAEGSVVATRFTLSGVHERPFNDQPATNRRVEFGGFVIDRFEAGRIAETHMLLDVWGLSQRTSSGVSGALQ